MNLDSNHRARESNEGSAPASGASRFTVAGDEVPQLENPPGAAVPRGAGGEAVRTFSTATSRDVIPEGDGRDDDRERVTPTTDYPWRAICELIITAGNGETLHGTGWFAGPRLIVTAGHCVYDHARGGWIRSILVTPGQDGGRQPHGSFRVNREAVRCSLAWFERAETTFDYGGIVLPAVSGLGHFGFASLSDHELHSYQFNVAGYSLFKQPERCQWWHGGRLSGVFRNLLHYKLDTDDGQSGAPLWRRLPNGPQVVGIHTRGRHTVNEAVRITLPVQQALQEWLLL